MGNGSIWYQSWQVSDRQHMDSEAMGEIAPVWNDFLLPDILLTYESPPGESMKYVDIDRIYQTLSLDRIPWNCETPPDLLVSLIHDGKIKPCKTVDLGCGTGNYAIYLGEQGFEVTGVDSSPVAIRIAQDHAKERGVPCTFIVADLIGSLQEVNESFDFAFDWELMHHIYPEDRPTLVKNVYHLLNPGTSYVSVCFSEEDPQFGGQGKYRTTPIGTILYFSSEPEIRDLLSPYFMIHELKSIEIPGKYGSHRAIYVRSIRR